MNQLTLFDYNQLDSETRIITKQRAGEIRSLMRSTAENVMQVGEKLLEVQLKLGNGQFDAWLSAEFDWSRRTAYNFIGVFKQFRDRANFAQIDVATSALYLLAAPSTPDSAVDEVMARAEAGESISHSQAKGIVAEHKAEESARLEAQRPRLPETQPQITRIENPPPAPWEEDDAAGATVEPAYKVNVVGNLAGDVAPKAPAPPPPPAPAAPTLPPPAPVISAAPLLISLTVRESGALISAQRGGQPVSMTNSRLDQVGNNVQMVIDRIFGQVIEADDDMPEWLT